MLSPCACFSHPQATLFPAEVSTTFDPRAN
jgi:hypothetical protein